MEKKPQFCYFRKEYNKLKSYVNFHEYLKYVKRNYSKNKREINSFNIHNLPNNFRNNNKANKFILDSGASEHVTGNLEKMTLITRLKNPLQLITADGSVKHVTHQADYL